MDPKRAAFHTLGCRLNQSETNIIKDNMVEAGYAVVPIDQPADLAIINTCTVTRLAESKCRQTIRQFIAKNPKAYVAVVGCYSQMGSKEIAQIPGVDIIIGNQDKLNVLNYVGNLEKNETPVIVRDKINKEDFSINFVGDYPFNKRANLKIQDGCDFMCSFCRIPFARGRARSREFDNMIDEAKNLVSRGVRELILTGVNIGTYDHSGYQIVEVCDALNNIPGLDRVRISSIEPTTVPIELFSRMADKDHNLLPFLHLPLQSGSDKVLKSMRRKYCVSEYEDFLAQAVSLVPDLYIGTDIMVGYPCEGEKEFQETCDMFLRNPFSFCHVFTYSEREETLAGRRSDQIPMEIRHARSAQLRRLSSKKLYDYYSLYIGQTMDVLFEDPKQGSWPGYTDNYIRVYTQHNQDLANKLCCVRIDSQSADFVEGTVLEVIS